MCENKTEITTRPIEIILRKLPSGIRRVLVIRSAPEKLFYHCIESLRRWNPELEITVLCHRDGQVPGCDLGLDDTLVSEGQIYDASKALTLACADVPGRSAMADEDDADHVTFFLEMSTL